MKDQGASTVELPAVAAGILAGGRATRYGGRTKGLLELPDGRTIVERTLEELARVGVAETVILANDAEPYARLGPAVVADLRTGLGPLAGIEAALDYYGDRFDAILFAPCDLPALGAGELQRLLEAFHQSPAPAVFARTRETGGNERRHPLCAVVGAELRAEISRALDRGECGVKALWRELGAEAVSFDDAAAFYNVNTPEDLAQWQNSAASE